MDYNFLNWLYYVNIVVVKRCQIVLWNRISESIWYYQYHLSHRSKSLLNDVGTSYKVMQNVFINKTPDQKLLEENNYKQIAAYFLISRGLIYLSIQYNHLCRTIVLSIMLSLVCIKMPWKYLCNEIIIWK